MLCLLTHLKPCIFSSTMEACVLIFESSAIDAASDWSAPPPPSLLCGDWWRLLSLLLEGSRAKCWASFKSSSLIFSIVKHLFADCWSWFQQSRLIVSLSVVLPVRLALTDRLARSAHWHELSTLSLFSPLSVPFLSSFLFFFSSAYSFLLDVIRAVGTKREPRHPLLVWGTK